MSDCPEMRAVIQRVSRARVMVENELVGAIGPGLAVLVGVGAGDSQADTVALASKIAGLRIFADENGHMNRSVLEAGGEILVISQFTLYGDVARGRRPSFGAAAPPEVAEPLIAGVIDRLAAMGVKTAQGRFGARMEVELTNQGPVTILIETRGGRYVALSEAT